MIRNPLVIIMKGKQCIKVTKRLKKTFPAIAKEEGLPQYADNQLRRYELLDMIVQGVEEGNEYQAVNALRERNKVQMPGRLRNELTEWKFDLVQIKALMMNAVRKKGISDLMVDGIHTEFTQRIDRAASVEECHKISEQMVEQFCSLTRIEEFHDYSTLVQKVILTVDMDLSQNLTLQHFSESLNVNDSYLSNLFRQEVGMTLTDYVTERRMHQAAALLLNTQYPIKTIAKQVGITDVHYFSRIFKKRMNKPPSQYRLDRG